MKTKKEPFHIILEDLITRWDVKTYLDHLDMLESHLFNIKVDILEKMGEYFPHDKKEKLLEAAKDSSVDVKDPQEFQGFIKDLRKEIEALPIVILRIAYEPTEKSLKILSGWFVRTYGKKVLFDLIIDRSLVGGAVIEFNGRVKDYSLKTYLKKYLKKTKTASHG